MKTLKTTLSTLAIFAIAGPALAADFTTLDANTDGQISFEEYKTIAEAEGKTVTLAAQEFTRMSQGDAIITQDEFFLAEALAGEPYALQPGFVEAPAADLPVEAEYEPMEFVEPFETSPDAVNIIEPPVAVEDVPAAEELTDSPAPVIMEKPLDIDSLVAGEVETSMESATDALEDEGLTDITPLEEVEPDLSTPSLEKAPDFIEGESQDVGSEAEEDLTLKTPDIEEVVPSEIY